MNTYIQLIVGTIINDLLKKISAIVSVTNLQTNKKLLTKMFSFLITKSYSVRKYIAMTVEYFNNINLPIFLKL